MNAVDVLTRIEKYFDRNHSLFCMWGGLFSLIFFGIFIPYRMLAIQEANLTAQLSAYQMQNSYLVTQVNDMSQEMKFLQLSYDDKQKVMREVDCLAKNIYFEAQGEPRAGKIAVAEVTMNRVKSRQFAKTVCGVVYQKTKGTCQFSWVCQDKKAIRNRLAWKESLQIAEMILIFDREYGIIGSAKYFHADYVDPEWADHKKLIRKIGNHIFYH